MKKNFWLILAVLSLLGMIIMPGTAHSAPIALPAINPSRVILPNYPLPRVTIHQPRIQLPMPQLQPSLIPTSLPSVIAVAPAVLAPIVTAEAPAVAAPGAPLISAPQSAIPASRIEGISVPAKARKGVGGILSRLNSQKGARELTALFDGAQQKTEPVAVPAEPVQSAPADPFEDNSLTLPESDLAEEIGLGY
jgi:hypothetical protein